MQCCLGWQLQAGQQPATGCWSRTSLLLAAPQTALREAGLSERKISYLRDLAAHFEDGRLSDAGIAGVFICVAPGAAVLPCHGGVRAVLINLIPLSVPPSHTAAAMGEAELEAALTAVKGIGLWTCHMHALFHLGAPDVLPVGDLGVRKGLKHLYGLKVSGGGGGEPGGAR